MATLDCDLKVIPKKGLSQTLNRSWSRNVCINLSLSIYIIVCLMINGGLSPFFRRGFFCQDATIQYPIKTDTVSFKWLLVISLLLPILVIKFLDKRLSRSLDSRSSIIRIRKISDTNAQHHMIDRLRSSGATEVIDNVKRRIMEDREDIVASEEEVLFESPNTGIMSPEANQIGELDTTYARKYSNSQLYLFGFATTGLFTGIGKTTCGRLRPHFMQRCNPNITCSLPENYDRYIVDFHCTNDIRQRDISYITTSWPSGHASIIFYSMLYMILYLDTVISVMRKAHQSKQRSPIRMQPLMLSSIYALMIGLAIFISMSRISDYHHHPTDVLSGFVIGSIVAILQARFLLKPIYTEFL